MERGLREQDWHWCYMNSLHFTSIWRWFDTCQTKMYLLCYLYFQARVTSLAPLPCLQVINSKNIPLPWQLFPFTLCHLENLTTNISSQYHPKSDYENMGNDHQQKKLLIDKQILLVSTLEDSMENIHTDVGVCRAKYVMQLLCSMYTNSSSNF